MRKNRGGSAVGYTLVEVLIFIALTSFLLIIAISNLNASQKNTQFSQSVRSFESLLSDVINDTPTGYFTESTDQTCDASGGPVVITDGAPPPSTNLGESNSCVYLGKALQFGASDSAGAGMRLFTIAGSRTGAFVDLASADPTAVASSLGGSDTVEEIRLPSGLVVTRVFRNTGAAYVAADDRDILAIVTDINGASLTDNGSSQSVQIGGLIALGTNNKVDAIDAIDTLGPPVSAPLDTSTDGFVICLQFDNDKRASVTVGVAGSPGAFLRIDDYNINGGCG